MQITGVILYNTTPGGKGSSFDKAHYQETDTDTTPLLEYSRSFTVILSRDMTTSTTTQTRKEGPGD
jgi:hypothetical protein